MRRAEEKERKQAEATRRLMEAQCQKRNRGKTAEQIAEELKDAQRFMEIETERGYLGASEFFDYSI